MRATFELYDVKGEGASRSAHKASVLYTPRGGAVSNKREIESAIEGAITASKESGVRYWFNSLRIARILVSMTDDSSLRFYPSIRPISTSRFVWRVLLGSPEGAFELIPYRVEFNKLKLLERLTPVVENEKKEKKT